MVTIKEIENTGENDIRLTFPSPKGDFQQLLLPKGSATSMFVLPAFAPDIQLEFFVQLASCDLPPRRFTIHYENGSGKNAFFYAVESGPPLTAGTTTPGNSVLMSVTYTGDGVVIVGTADF